jgi:hypothetical protein
MKKYLLLRDNKQTGPHTYEEMLELGFKKYDLVWVEGKSAAWRYPGELPEFSAYAPLVEEQPFDRFYKKPLAQQRNQEEEKPTPNVQPIASETKQEKKTEEFLPQQETVQVPQEEKKIRRVAISMPANRNAQPKKQSSPVSPVTNVQDKPTMPAETTSKPIPIPDEAYLPKKAVADNTYVRAKAVVPDPIPAPAPLPEEVASPLPQSNGSVRWIQYAGVAVALASLVMIGILIGMGLDTETTQPVRQISVESPRVTELKEKLAQQPTVEPESQDQTIDIPAPPAGNSPASGVKVQSTEAVIREDLPKPTPSDKPVSENNTDRSNGKPGVAEPAHSTNFADNVAVTLNDYKVNVFGGIENVKVTVQNNNPVALSEIIVEMRYILSNRKVNTETIRFENLEPSESLTLDAPNSTRGIKLETRIVEVRK